MGLASVALAACVAVPSTPAAAAPREVEIDLREGSYLFAVPDGSLGPFHSEKLDAVSANALDALLLHAVVTNRLNANGEVHGEFVRIEDDRRFGAATVRAAAGIGGGVLGERSATVAVAETLVPNRRLALSGAFDITVLSPHEEQRVVGFGPEFAVGGVAVFARYYRASIANAAAVPSSACILANVALSRRAGLSLAANFGGEVNADRTSGFLPTSSGRFGTEISLAGRLALGTKAAVLVAYDGAVYRGVPGGALARAQHIVTVGLAVRPVVP